LPSVLKLADFVESTCGRGHSPQGYPIFWFKVCDQSRNLKFSYTAWGCGNADS
jgi:hypothetical protein